MATAEIIAIDMPRPKMRPSGMGSLSIKSKCAYGTIGMQHGPIMPKLRESPEESMRLVESIDRELARLDKRRRAYFLASQTEPGNRITARLRSLSHLRHAAMLAAASSRRIVSADEAEPASLALVSSIGSEIVIEWPAISADSAISESELLDGLV